MKHLKLLLQLLNRAGLVVERTGTEGVGSSYVIRIVRGGHNDGRDDRPFRILFQVLQHGKAITLSGIFRSVKACMRTEGNSLIQPITARGRLKSGPESCVADFR